MKNLYVIQRSNILLWVLIFIYGGAGIGVLTLPAMLAIKLLLLGWCLAVFWYHYWRNILFGGAEAIKAFAYTENGRWVFYDKRRRIMRGVLQKSSVALPYLAVLHFKVSENAGGVIEGGAIAEISDVIGCGGKFIALLRPINFLVNGWCNFLVKSLAMLRVCGSYFKFGSGRKDKSRFLSLVIFCDALPREDFRRLRVALITAPRKN